MGERLKIAVLFGGRSGEHEVSLVSARSVMAALDPARFEVIPVGITREGAWLVGADPMKALEEESFEETRPAAILPDPTRRGLNQLQPRQEEQAEQLSTLSRVDVVFPVLHGTFGEDGTVQGLLELANVPYVGAGVLASAVAMDKIIFKHVCNDMGLPIVPYVPCTRRRWEREPAAVLEEIEAQLTYPVFTKPANLGSSVGVSKCHDRADLRRGLNEAARYDRRVLVEEAVPEAREIEVSVLGNEAPSASVPGEIIPSREFYTYEAKYLDTGEDASELLIPAPLDEEMTARVQAIAIEAYCAIDGAGMARVDFLLSGESGELYLNEINTIPGFTSISMYPKLWEASGVSYRRLLSWLIDLALERHAENARSERVFRPRTTQGGSARR
ncbi:MAG: D-alanine--D-alanine ligase family protein [Anaerolineae bacterium]